MIITMFIKRRKSPLSTLWKLNGSSFEQTGIPFTLRCIVAGLVDIGPRVLDKNILLFYQCISLFHNYLPLEKSGPFISTILSPHPPRMLCAKFGWYWSSGCSAEDFEISLMYFGFFRIYSPLEKRNGPSFEQTWIPITQECKVRS